jgi:hypothetical protein
MKGLRGPGGHDSIGRAAKRLGLPTSFARDLVNAGALYVRRDAAGVAFLSAEEQYLLGVCGDLRRIGLSTPQLSSVTSWLRSLAPHERGPAAGRVCLARYRRSGWQVYLDDGCVDGNPEAVYVAGLVNAGRFPRPA